MTQPWWGRDRSPSAEPTLADRVDGGAAVPILHGAQPGKLSDALRALRPAFTPGWTAAGPDDAGIALLQLFDELGRPVLERLNRLPVKTAVEFLRIAGVVPRPALPATARLMFRASKGAPGAVTVGAGFQVTASAADGSGERVFFETSQTVYVTPAEIEAAFSVTGQLAQPVDIDADDEQGWQPFGPRPRGGSALLIGLTANVPVGASLSFGIEPAGVTGIPRPVTSGGGSVGESLPQQLLRWEFFDGGAFERLEVIRDETRNLNQSGIVELATPDQWRAGFPPGVTADEPLRWFRLRVAHGEFDQAPRLRSLRLNMTPAIALRTIRDEVVQFVPGSRRRRLRLSQRPVLDGSLELAVFDGVDSANETVWQQIADLGMAQPDDTVYTLDPVTGEIEVGDGVRGKLLPIGFRNVVARRYQIGGGEAGSVDAEAITALQQSAPFLTGVSNPKAASGGRDEASWTETMRTGPQVIRARNRAVTVADYELLAARADGADVGRVHAVSALHPDYAGARLPGVVTVFVVSFAKDGEKPVPDADTLSNVADFLSREVAPTGVRVVAAVPRFHEVAVRAVLKTVAGANAGNVVSDALRVIDDYLDPTTGGENRRGWPFGERLRYQALVRRLLTDVNDLSSITSLNLSADGVSLGVCEDYLPSENSLLWPGVHELVIEVQDQ